jgi:ABC-type nitrate/sulfonate/bicarbonate transport system permease component
MAQQEELPRWLGAVVPVLAVLGWEAAAHLSELPPYLPAPSTILARLGEMLASGE